jgi:hypothetical protein
MAELCIPIPDSNTAAAFIPTSVALLHSLPLLKVTNVKTPFPSEDRKDEINHVIVRGTFGAYSIDVKNHEKVQDLKEKLSDREGIPESLIWLSSCGCPLHDHRWLSDCGIHNGAFIQAHIRSNHTTFRSQ